jgi:hypothetical protein
VPERPIVKNWAIYSSPDYFSTTTTYTYTFRGIPINDFGNTYPKHGNAYAGISVCESSVGDDYKEYINQHLTSSLKADSIYCLSFYTTLADKVQIAIKNIGAYFSVNSSNLVSNSSINVLPQIINNNGFITDTINWVEIKGCFTAQGGEQYLTIGSFGNRANTDTVNVVSTNPLTGPGNNFSYYYIDSVSLWQNNFPTKVNEFTKEHTFLLYPNPNNGNMNMTYDLGKDTEGSMTLFDVTGKLINTYHLQNTNGTIEINESQLPNGIYIYFILVNGIKVNTNKIVIIK